MSFLKWFLGLSLWYIIDLIVYRALSAMLRLQDRVFKGCDCDGGVGDWSMSDKDVLITIAVFAFISAFTLSFKRGKYGRGRRWWFEAATIAFPVSVYLVITIFIWLTNSVLSTQFSFNLSFWLLVVYAVAQLLLLAVFAIERYEKDIDYYM